MSVLIGLALGYGFLLVVAVFFSDRLIFPVPPSSYGRDTAGVEFVKLPAGGEVAVMELSVEHPLFHILYNHGNAEDLGGVEPWLRTIAKEFHCSVVGYDYPGYGVSSGKPSERSVLESADAVFDWMVGRGIPEDHIVVWGRSIGSGPATYLAANHHVGGVILESAYKSTFTVVTKVPIVPFDIFDNISLIGKVECPVLVMHGKRDGVIPFSHGEALFARAKPPKSYLWVEDAGHDDLDMVGAEAYRNAIREFLSAIAR